MIYVFSFNNQLPRIFEVICATVTVEPTVLSYRKGRPESLNRQSVINSSAGNLKLLWEESFGINFKKTITAIECQIRKTLDDYVKFMKRHSKKVIEKEPNCGERKIQYYFIVLCLLLILLILISTKIMN